MSDIFREVDEEVRKEQFKKLWDRYGILVIAAAVLLVIAVGGWRAWQWWEAKKAAEAGGAFEAAIVLSQEGKAAEAEAAFAKIAAEGTASYRRLAKLREAAETAKRDPKAAVPLYDALAAEANVEPIMRDLAALRAGYILVDSASYDDIKSRLEPLTAADRAFRHSARVLLALAAWKANDVAAAKRWSDMVLADSELPPGVRNQVEMLMSLTADAKDKS